MPTSYSQKVLTAALDVAAASLPESRRRTSVFIVGSPRQNCGKTFIAQLLVDYFCLEAGEALAFDLDFGDDTLANRRPSMTERAEIDSTEAQMALFDRLVVNDGLPKVVDVGRAAFQRFFGLAEEISFFSEAHRRSVDVIILFPAETHPIALKAYEILRRRLQSALVVPVLNEALTKDRKVRERYPFTRAAAVPLQIPVLPPNLMAYAGRTDCSFADFHTKLPMSVPIDRAFELRSWTKRTFLEFRELELRLTLEKLRASLKA